jgi:alpha-L-fucosidase
VEPLTTVGKWLAQNGECAYGRVKNFRADGWGYGNMLCLPSIKNNTVYLWNWIWPRDGELIVGGFTNKLKSVKVIATGQSLQFKQEKYRIFLNDMPKEPQDKIAGIAVIALEFDGPPEYVQFAARPQLNKGRIYS